MTLSVNSFKRNLHKKLHKHKKTPQPIKAEAWETIEMVSKLMARVTRLELATSGVTGRCLRVNVWFSADLMVMVYHGFPPIPTQKLAQTCTNLHSLAVLAHHAFLLHRLAGLLGIVLGLLHSGLCVFKLFITYCWHGLNLSCDALRMIVQLPCCQTPRHSAQRPGVSFHH
jgi:hypothetical protein